MPSRRNIRCLRAEVRLDDPRVPDDLLRCPLRDRAPLLQHEDPLGQAQDGPHHMLDDHGAEPDLRLPPLKHLDGVPHLVRGKARERLVEQEEAGPRREGAPELEPLLLLDREGGSEGVRAGLELDETEDSLDLFGKVRPFTHGGTPSERRGHEDVLPNGQAGEWLGDLVGLRDARSDDTVPGEAVDPLSVEEDADGDRLSLGKDADQDLVRNQDDHGPEHRPEDGPHAPDDDHGEHRQREEEIEAVREHAGHVPREDGARGSREPSAQNIEDELHAGDADPDGPSGILVLAKGADSQAEPAPGHPPRERDFRSEESPDRVVLGPDLEPEVHGESGPIAEGRRAGDDVEGREGRHEGRGREVRAPEAQRHDPDHQGEHRTQDAPERHAGEGRDVPDLHPVPERIPARADEHDVAKAHVPGHPRDQVDRVCPRRVDHEEDQEDEDRDGEDGAHYRKDREDEAETLGGRPERPHLPPCVPWEDSEAHGTKSEERRPENRHRRIPSGANARTGMTTRNAAAYAISTGTNTWRTSSNTPIVTPPTRLPHIFPRPPRTTITKLIGAYVRPTRGVMPPRRYTVSRAPLAIVTANPIPVAIAATEVGFTPISFAAAMSWLYARIALPK